MAEIIRQHWYFSTSTDLIARDKFFIVLLEKNLFLSKIVESFS